MSDRLDAILAAKAAGKTDDLADISNMPREPVKGVTPGH